MVPALVIPVLPSVLLAVPASSAHLPRRLSRPIDPLTTSSGDD
jgi:hypothetical protein